MFRDEFEYPENLATRDAKIVIAVLLLLLAAALLALAALI